MIKLRITKNDLKMQAARLQSSSMDLHESLAKRAEEAVRGVEERMQASFPGMMGALMVDLSVDPSGVVVKISASNQGLLELVRDEAINIITEEFTNIAGDVQQDLHRSMTGAGI